MWTAGLYCLLEFTFLLCEAVGATGAGCRRLIVLRCSGVLAVELACLPQASETRGEVWLKSGGISRAEIGM